jgi:glycerol-3-phosphate acyltransferase PlsY
MTRGRVAGLAILATAAYAVGSIQVSRVVQRLVSDEPLEDRVEMRWGDGKVITVRTTGATSIEESAGPTLGVATTLLDMSKAIVPMLVLRRAYPGRHLDILWATVSIVGQIMPLQHGFKGGRGSSMLIGACTLFDPLAVPLSIATSQVLGIYVLRDPMLATIGWPSVLPLYFGLRGRRELVVFALVLNAVRWLAWTPELRQIWTHHRDGEMQSRAFHEAFEQGHNGYIHKWLRERGLVHYDYMDEEPDAAGSAAGHPGSDEYPATISA